VEPRPLQLTLREMQRHLTEPRVLGILAVVAVLLGLAGPFGTFETLALLPRLAYWVATVVFTYAAGYGLSLLADNAWGRGRPLWQRFIIMVIPAGLGATLIVSVLNVIAFGTVNYDWTDALVLAGQCFAVAMGVVVVLLMTNRHDFPSGPREAAPTTPAILDRVPLPQRGALLALVVEDHYVDIVTEKGKALVLMRLADAIRETAPVAGIRIHRSHWIATNAVVKAHRSDGKLMVELSNGMRLPVSRSAIAAVKAAGLV